MVEQLQTARKDEILKCVFQCSLLGLDAMFWILFKNYCSSWFCSDCAGSDLVSGHFGGIDPYLGKINRQKFLGLTNHASERLNYIPTGTAISLAHDLAFKRRKKTIEVLISCKGPKLVAHIQDIPYPSKRGCTTWQRKIVFASQTDKPAKK